MAKAEWSPVRHQPNGYTSLSYLEGCWSIEVMANADGQWNIYFEECRSPWGKPHPTVEAAQAEAIAELRRMLTAAMAALPDGSRRDLPMDGDEAVGPLCDEMDYYMRQEGMEDDDA
jgi:hypothetical protein